MRSTLFIHTCLPPHSFDFLNVRMDSFCALRSLIWSFLSLNSVFPLLLLTLSHHLPSLLSDPRFHSFLKSFPETPPTSAMHSAVSCRGSVLQPACVQLGAVPQDTTSVLPQPKPCHLHQCNIIFLCFSERVWHSYAWRYPVGFGEHTPTSFWIMTNALKFFFAYSDVTVDTWL